MEHPPGRDDQLGPGRSGQGALPAVLRCHPWIVLTCVLVVPASALGASLVEAKQYIAPVSVGVVLGAFLGIGLALLRERLDRGARELTADEGTSAPSPESSANASERLLRANVVGDR